MRIRNLTLLLLILFLSVNSLAQIPTDGLVGHWPFDGNYNDVSGNANHGTAVGTNFAYDRFNNPTGCVEFNGISSIIRVVNSDSLNLDSYQESYTISFWCQSDDPIISGAGSARFIEKWNCLGSMPYPYSIIIVDDDIKASVYDMSLTSQPFILDVFGDQWLNIVFVSNFETDSLLLYLNGVLSDKVENNSVVSTANNNDITFGNNHVENRPYKGLMDDIRFYSRVLNEDEIISIFNNDTINNDTIITIQSLYNQGFSLYPNPCTDKLMVSSDNVKSIMIYNELGVLLETILNSNTINMSKYNRGIYFIRVSTESIFSMKRVLKI